MKYLSRLLPIVFLVACNQTPDNNSSGSYLDIQPDTIARQPEAKENNKWRYDLPMPGNTYRNTNTASLKANGVNAYLKLVNGKDINMAVLKLEDSKFYEDQSMIQEVQIQFDTTEPKMYTCSIDPLFGFLVIEPYADFIKKIKGSHTLIIQAVTQKNAYRSEVRYENHRTSRSYSYRGRRRTRWRNERVPVTITKTEIEPANQTWIFNSAGLVWKY